jgi:hypothetical protein
VNFVTVSSIDVTVATSAGTSVVNTDRTAGNFLTVKVVATYSSITGLIDLNALSGIAQIQGSNTFVIGP